MDSGSRQIVLSEVVHVSQFFQGLENFFDVRFDPVVEVAVAVEEVDTKRQRERGERMDLEEFIMA